MSTKIHQLELKYLGIDTQSEYFIYMRADCPICRSEGFESQTRVKVSQDGKELIATLHTVQGDLLTEGQASLSLSAWKSLSAKEGMRIELSHVEPIRSFNAVRGKIFGKRFTKDSLKDILHDIQVGRYSDIHISAFVSACAGDNLDLEEITRLTECMVEAGDKMEWGRFPVVDKHCIGGLPGNRTTPIVVSIVAAAGLTVPKTSSRAITSPAGTADTLETITNVNLSADQIKAVVRAEGGCFVWGGGAALSPVDDLIIRVERALDIDGEGQVVASVLSKKAAAGATIVVIDIPVGPTAKVRSHLEGLKLKYYFSVVGMALGMKIDVIISDGSQPVGIGIGPALEARDVLAVLQGAEGYPQDLRAHALVLAARMLELGEKAAPGQGKALAAELLDSGKAWAKFKSICRAQGRFEKPPQSKYSHEVRANRKGIIKSINNRILAKIAKLAGAPGDKAAGIEVFCKIGDPVIAGTPLFRVHAEASGELEYALHFANSSKPVYDIS